MIDLAHNHVGVFEERIEESGRKDYKITSRVNTARGIACRIVAETLPAFAEAVEPTLEDAYMYLIMEKEVK